MSVSNRFLWRLKLFAVLVVLTTFAPLLYVQLFGLPDFFESKYHPLLNGIIGGSIFWGIEILWIPSRHGQFFRQLPFLTATILRTLFVLVMLTVVGPLALFILYGQVNLTATLQAGPTLYVFAVGLVFLLFGLAQVVRVVGPRILLNIVFGRYRRPVKEERIFLFLDLKGSTALSEELGDIGVQELINQFFFDITGPILEWGGEIHRYVGDQIVVTWAMKKGLEGASCLQCCLAIRARIAAEAPRYQARFGLVPDFRIGLHGGPIVASQCGDVKQEIVYFGDTINTTARIEQYCKQAGRKLLISQDLAAGLPDRAAWRFENVGSVQLRGRSSEMSLLALEGQP